MLNVGERIICRREELEISQVGLAKTIGLSATTLSKYEKNLREPRADIIVKLADVLQTTTDYLLCRTDDSVPLKKDATWARLDREEDYLLQTFRLLPEREKGQLLERLQIIYEQHSKKQAAVTTCSRNVPIQTAVKK